MPIDPRVPQPPAPRDSTPSSPVPSSRLPSCAFPSTVTPRSHETCQLSRSVYTAKWSYRGAEPWLARDRKEETAKPFRSLYQPQPVTQPHPLITFDGPSTSKSRQPAQTAQGDSITDLHFLARDLLLAPHSVSGLLSFRASRTHLPPTFGRAGTRGFRCARHLSAEPFAACFAPPGLLYPQQFGQGM
jgi:hypothetical protein